MFKCYFLDMNIDPIHECCILLDFKNAVKDAVSYLSQNILQLPI